MILKCIDKIKFILRVISCIMICTLTIIVAMQVVNRNFLQHSFTWVEEVAGIAMIFVTYLGASMATVNNSNTRIDFFIRMLPEKGTQFFEILVDIICVVFLCIVCGYSIKLMGNNLATFTPALKLPIAINYFAVLLGSVLMVAFYIINLYVHIKKFMGKECIELEEVLNK